MLSMCTRITVANFRKLIELNKFSFIIRSLAAKVSSVLKYYPGDWPFDAQISNQFKAISVRHCPLLDSKNNWCIRLKRQNCYFELKHW